MSRLEFRVVDLAKDPAAKGSLARYTTINPNFCLDGALVCEWLGVRLCVSCSFDRKTENDPQRCHRLAYLTSVRNRNDVLSDSSRGVVIPFHSPQEDGPTEIVLRVDRSEYGDAEPLSNGS